MSERILCAAIWVDTGLVFPDRPSSNYPPTGIVFAGWRHSDCYTSLNAWAENLSANTWNAHLEEQVAGKNSGFITSTGRFVNHQIAYDIAVKAEQIINKGIPYEEGFLKSEDLY